jgi:hypothetical protein
MEEFLKLVGERGLHSPKKGARVLGQSSPQPRQDEAGLPMGMPVNARLGSLEEGGGGGAPDVPPAVRNFVMAKASPIPGFEEGGGGTPPRAAGHSAAGLSSPGLDIRAPERPEPWQGAVDDEERQGRIDQAELLTSLTEGIGNIRAPDVGAARIKALTGRDVAGPPRRYVAGGLRREAARAEDELTSAEREAFKSAGLNLPPGMTRSALRQMGLRAPSIASPTQQGHLAARREELELERARLGLSEGGLAARQEGLAQSRTRLERPPAGQLDKSLSLARVRKFVDRIDESYDEVKDKVGPVFGRLQIALRTLGLNNPKVAQLQAELTDAMGDYLTLKTGAQRGMPEMTFLLQALPRISDSNATFRQLLSSWRQRIEDEAGAREGLFKELGYKGSGAEAARGARVTFRATDGTTVTMPRAEAEEDQEAGEGEIVE